MKILEKHIPSFQEDNFFSPIRDKVDFARIILFSARLLLLESEIDSEKNPAYLKLIVEKMSRLFFYTENKYFSIAFPFKMLIVDNCISNLQTHSGFEIDNQIISESLSILLDGQFALKPSLVDYLWRTDETDNPGIYLLEQIFQFEAAYIRYDIDPKNENKKLHPLIHFDVNYSSQGTYKLGLESKIIAAGFENLLNIQTDCYFLSE